MWFKRQASASIYTDQHNGNGFFQLVVRSVGQTCVLAQLLSQAHLTQKVSGILCHIYSVECYWLLSWSQMISLLMLSLIILTVFPPFFLSREPFIILSGGLSYDTVGRRPCLTVMHGKSTAVLEMDYSIVDFLTLCETPYPNGRFWKKILPTCLTA